ncbi:hypothetical protein RQP54_17165 [Curvibacter sp. APW13]|uniref:hypothetical protein n=1 Tax=Curvibacter sp. APW13 TaxID=3077236 RepID=UPI0028E05983|nr:hypothetical protein [Curvibacter sp. APW13]MDT8992605.1 hypothetical protein [Curvibacter sp. APW13]
MTPPLLNMAIQRPNLLLKHIEGYSLLLQEEWDIQTDHWQRLVWLYSVFIFSLGSGSVLLGVACLISISHYGLEFRTLCIMLMIGLAPFGLAYFSWDAMKKLPTPGSMERLLKQVRADMQVLSESTHS